MFYSNAQKCTVVCNYVKGITALEMAEGKPPYGDIHPMRVCTVLFYVVKLNNLTFDFEVKLTVFDRG